MSETRWRQLGGQPSWTMDTPVGRAAIAQTDDGMWIGQLEAADGTRQSQPLAMRDEAEAWVETQVDAVQRESDVAPAEGS
ncbi:MAG: hypothetical protein RLZZ387_5509 [Chloroflexota bacterium]|jgi:hypothetical protein